MLADQRFSQQRSPSRSAHSAEEETVRTVSSWADQQMVTGSPDPTSQRHVTAMASTSSGANAGGDSHLASASLCRQRTDSQLENAIAGALDAARHPWHPHPLRRTSPGSAHCSPSLALRRSASENLDLVFSRNRSARTDSGGANDKSASDVLPITEPARCMLCGSCRCVRTMQRCHGLHYLCPCI